MIQRFAKSAYKSVFNLNHMPKLLYICKEDRSKSPMYRNMHMHETIAEIIFIYHGSCTYVIDGHEYYSEKGDIIIINSNVIHDEIPHTYNTMNSYCVGFSNFKLPNLPVNHIIPENKSCIIKSGEYYETIKSLFELIYTELYEEKKGGEEISTFALNTMLSIILRNPLDEIENINSSISDNLPYQVKNYINKHYLENITLKSIAKELKVSPSYISHRFKEATDYSPIDYVIKRRIGEAQSLLINTNYNATKISIMVGYENTNYFNTLFTKKVGMTPIKYRKNYTKN